MVQRLSAVDASFLTLETPSTPMQSGGLGIFEPGLAFGDVAKTVSERLEQVPLARKRLQQIPLGPPAWVDDTHFDLSFHLRHAALPAPGDAQQLADLLCRIVARPLDRGRPLWELYVIEGLEGGRTAVFRKMHLAFSDDAQGDLFSALLDDSPEVPVTEDVSHTPWRPLEPPSSASMALEGLWGRTGDLLAVGRSARRLAAAPRRLGSAALSVAGSTVGVLARLARHAPPSPLNARLTPHRRFATARLELEDLRRVRRACGGSINDVVVAITGDAVGRLLRWRGHDTKDLDLRVMVPVRVHAPRPATGPAATVEEGEVDDGESLEGQAPDPKGMDPRTMGNGVVGVLVPLPVMDMDPVARLYRAMGELAALRESRQAVAANDLAKLANFAPSTLHALAARLISAEQRYNVALSNAPGPQGSRYLRGVRLEASYPFIPLAGDAALSIAVSSYAGGVFVGLLGDRDAMPDLERLPALLVDAAEDLLRTAEGQQ